MAGIAADEIVEHTLTQIQECYLFELPPRVRAQGWLAADMTKQMWTGRMRVVQRGNEAAIMLIDRRDGKLFAMCKVADGAVERVPDSSRYFVIKIQNAQGRHAFVGLAFDDRNQAFDFNVALQEFKKDVERSKMLEREGSGGDGATNSGDGDGSGEPPAPKVDLSLKQGEKIKISIGVGSKTSSRPRRSGRDRGGSNGLTLAPPPRDTARKPGGGIGLLAPPPGDTRRARSGSGVGQKAAAPIPSPAPVPAAGGTAFSQPPGGGGGCGDGCEAPAAATATMPDSPAMSQFPGGMGGMMMPTPTSGGGAGVAGMGGLGFQSGGPVSAGGGLIGASNSHSSPSPAPAQEDDDPFGLGLGSSSTTAPSQQGQGLAAAGGWGGLSDMSGLSAGLPITSLPSAQPPQQQVGYSSDPFAQPQPQAFPPQAGGRGSSSSGGNKSSATVNDLLDGLF